MIFNAAADDVKFCEPNLVCDEHATCRTYPNGTRHCVCNAGYNGPGYVLPSGERGCQRKAVFAFIQVGLLNLQSVVV